MLLCVTHRRLYHIGNSAGLAREESIVFQTFTQDLQGRIKASIAQCWSKGLSRLKRRSADRGMEPTKAPWADKKFEIPAVLRPSQAPAQKKLPMEPTKAPWADGGAGRVFSAPEPGSLPGQSIAAIPASLLFQLTCMNIKPAPNAHVNSLPSDNRPVLMLSILKWRRSSVKERCVLQGRARMFNQSRIITEIGAI